MQPIIRKPTADELKQAVDKIVPDLIRPGLRVLFVGINPGLYSAAVGHHFARPGNRFWPALHAGGFTPRLFSPFEEAELLKLGYGITNVVTRATAAAGELSRDEFLEGATELLSKVKKFKPRFVAILGVGAYRTGFNKPKARIGRQDELIGDAVVWVLPNPSGLNANYQRDDLKRLFAELHEAAADEQMD